MAIVGGFFGSRLNVKATDHRWEASERARHNEETDRRLSRLYEPLVQSAATIQAVAHERGYVTSADGSVENRDARHIVTLKQAYKIVEEVGGALLIDRDARPLREMYNRFRMTFDQFLSASEMMPPSTERAEKIETLRQELGKLAIEIQEAAEVQLDELNTVATLTP